MNHCFLSMPSMDMGLTVVDWHRSPPPAGLWILCTGRRMNCRSPFICFAEPASSRRIHPRPSGRPLLQGGTCLKAPSIESQTFTVRNPISIQAKRSAPKTQDRLPQPLMAEKRRRIMLCAANTDWPSALSAELLSYPSSPNAFSQMALYFRKRALASSSFFPFRE